MKLYINDKDLNGISDHRPLTYTVKANLKLKEPRRRVAKSLFFVSEAIREAKTAYEEGIESMLNKLDGCVNSVNEPHTQSVFTKVDKYITGPWERIIKSRPPRKPLWWNRNIGTAKQKRRYIARKLHKAKTEADRWKDTYLCVKVEQLHVDLTEQQKSTRRFSRKAQAKLEQRTKDRLKEAGLTEQSQAISRDRRGEH